MDRKQIFEKLLEIPYDEVLIYANANSEIRDIVNDVEFWRGKTFHDFKVGASEFNQTSLSPEDRYLEILSRREITFGSERYVSLEKCVDKALELDDVSLFQYFHLSSMLDLNMALLNACRYNANNIIIYIESKGINNWNWALRGSAKAGNLKRCEHYISKGADDIRGAMVSAIYNRKFEVAHAMLDLGADNYEAGFEAAASVGHRELVEYFYKCGAKGFGAAYSAAKDNGYESLATLIKNFKLN